MTSETVFCDHCGLYSFPGPFCQNCGQPLQKLSTDQVRFSLPRWGRISIRFIGEDLKNAEIALVHAWQKIESETEQSLLPSQMGKLQPFTGSVELYGSEFSARSVKEQLSGIMAVDFQELPDYEIPRKPSTPPPSKT